MDTQQPPTVPPTGSTSGNELGMPLTILSFCIPLAGIIIWFMKKDKEPAAAKTACYAAIGGIVLGIVINIVVTVFFGASSMGS